MNIEVADTYFFAHRITESILEISKVLAGKYELNDILRRTVESVKKISNASACSIFLLDETERYLKMKAGTGYKEDLSNKAYYDLDVDEPAREKIGLTAWIALNKKSFSAKNREELTSHRAWSGKYDDQQYSGDDVCNTFYGVPLITNDKSIGVIKIENKQPGFNHPESYFTQEEQYIVDILSTVVAIVVRNKQLTDEQDKQHKCRVGLYKLGAKLQEQNDMVYIISYFLRGLTAGSRIGLNRAIYFEYNTILKRLSGQMALGPLDKVKGKEMRDIMEEKFGSFDDDDNDFIPIRPEDFGESIPLNSKVSNSVINLEKYNRCSELAKALENKIEKNIFQICRLSDSPEETLITGELYDFLKDLEFEDFIIIGIKVSDEIHSFTFCDNIYSHKEFDKNTKNLIEILLGQMSKAMEKIYSKSKADAEKEEASRKAMAMLAHTIKNDLFPIPTKLSDALTLSEGNHELKELLEYCHKSVNEVYEKIKELIEWKIPEVHIEESDSVKNIIDYIIRELKSFSPIVHLKQDYHLKKNNLYVEVDRKAITEVFRNLMSNTINVKPKPEVPEVNILISYLQESELKLLGLIDERNFVKITYEDNGPGVDVKDIERIFEYAFSRTGGTGLGLTYAKEVIEKHGGKICCVPKQGGARFEILLPVFPRERGL